MDAAFRIAYPQACHILEVRLSMSFVKYRVKEVAADFGVAPKEISEIIGKYYERPKSNSQVLTDVELNLDRKSVV